VTSTRSSGRRYPPASRAGLSPSVRPERPLESGENRESGSGRRPRPSCIGRTLPGTRGSRRGTRGTPKGGPVGRAGTRRTPGSDSPPLDRRGTSRSRSARRPQCPTTRGREWRPVWRNAPGPCADRIRRSRTRRFRRAPLRAPALDGDLLDGDPAVAYVHGCWHQLRGHGAHGRDISGRTLWPQQRLRAAHWRCSMAPPSMPETREGSRMRAREAGGCSGRPCSSTWIMDGEPVGVVAAANARWPV
jgi:hypothetical protein